jgi:hypothetical protein
MIASNAIDHLTGDGEGGFVAVLKDNSKVKISRTYAAKIRDGIW